MKLISFFLLIAILLLEAEAQYEPPFDDGGYTPPSDFGGITMPSADVCSVFSLAPDLPTKNGLVDGICDMAKNWLDGVKGIGDLAPEYRSILTENQKKYWDAVTQCKSTRCICECWDNCTSTNDDWYGKVTRKEIRAMTDPERHRFFYAMNKLKHDKIDGWSKFDIMTGYHFFVPFTPAAHFSAGLLPFHRELMKNFEVALRYEHPLAFWPYWDSTLDAELPNPQDTVFFSDELMGGGNGNVTSGPFSFFTGESNANFPVELFTGPINRAFGVAAKGVLYRKEYLEIIWAIPNIQGLVFCTNPFLDTIHAGVHLYVGGMMALPATSAGDPLFYLHHTFIDYIWEQWRLKNQNRDERENDWALPCPYNPFDFPFMRLYPFPVQVKDGYSNNYTDEFYSYQEQPSCENNCHDSKFLVCSPKKNQCLSKIVVGGDCTGLDDIDICYKGKCQNGQCVAS